jgi:undecaprenyl pyrophosphate synthase
MDGSGRWAERRGLPCTEGHTARETAVSDAVDGALELAWAGSPSTPSRPTTGAVPPGFGVGKDVVVDLITHYEDLAWLRPPIRHM